MTDQPRLSRRELREQGKLQPRPVDAPSLTETGELRLRRPSRKEMREAERAAREAEGFTNSQYVPQVDNHGDRDGSSPEISEQINVPEASGEAAEPEASAADATETRKSVFDRFDSDDEGLSDSEVSEVVIPAETDVVRSGSAGAEEITDGTDGSSLQDRLLAMTARQRTGEEAESGAEVATEAMSTSTPIQSTTATVYDDFDDDEPRSLVRSVLMLVVIILVGIIVGYIVGSWIYSTWFAGGISDALTTIRLQL